MYMLLLCGCVDYYWFSLSVTFNTGTVDFLFGNTKQYQLIRFGSCLAIQRRYAQQIQVKWILNIHI